MPETTDIDDGVFQYEGSEMSQCISGFGRNALELIEDVATRHKDMDPEDAERVRWHVGELVRWCRHFNGKAQRLEREKAELLTVCQRIAMVHGIRDAIGHYANDLAAAEGRQPE